MKVINTERIPIKMWLDEIDNGALEQAKNLANLPVAFKHIALMPDAHKGYGMPIGGVLTAKDVIVPNAVGSDIGCGCTAVKTTLNGIDIDILRQITREIYTIIPIGFNRHQDPQRWEGFDRAPDLRVIQEELGFARYYIGSLGNGNHFIEIQRGNDGHVWVMLHSGSRSLGEKIAHRYHKKAVDLCERWHANISTNDLAFLSLDSREGIEYFAAMQFCLEFAKANRSIMMARVLGLFDHHTGAKKLREIDAVHNYAAHERHFGQKVLVHRTGAIRAGAGEMGLIPGSMGTKSYIVRGLGNTESFQSCSHGAGRRMGRRQALRELNLDEEQAKMAGVIHRPLRKEDLDEAPGAYKDIAEVMSNQSDLVEIIVELRPLAVVKG